MSLFWPGSWISGILAEAGIGQDLYLFPLLIFFTSNIFSLKLFFDWIYFYTDGVFIRLNSISICKFQSRVFSSNLCWFYVEIPAKIRNWPGPGLKPPSRRRDIGQAGIPVDYCHEYWTSVSGFYQISIMFYIELLLSRWNKLGRYCIFLA